MSLTLEIVTPEARVYADTIDAVVLPTVVGEIGVLPGHIPVVTQIESGELRVTKNGQTQRLAVGSGFVEVESDRVHVLAEHAITEEKIDETAVEEAMRRAEQQLREAAQTDPNELERLTALVRFSGVQLALKRSTRHH